MEDILASIRRILSEDEAQVAAAPPAGQGAPASGEIDGDDVLVLDESMMADEAASFPGAPATPYLAALPQTVQPPLSPAAPPRAAEPAAVPSALLAPEAAEAAASAMGTLIRTLADHPGGDPLTPLQVRGGGPTIEDIVREEIRPLLKAWLDANLPTLTERLVREEIQRLADRAAH
jgi:cell pole-organizing protein PopZ